VATAFAAVAKVASWVLLSADQLGETPAAATCISERLAFVATV
jgi:hypothetical protein